MLSSKMVRHVKCAALSNRHVSGARSGTGLAPRSPDTVRHVRHGAPFESWNGRGLFSAREKRGARAKTVCFHTT